MSLWVIRDATGSNLDPNPKGGEIKSAAGGRAFTLFFYLHFTNDPEKQLEETFRAACVFFPAIMGYISGVFFNRLATYFTFHKASFQG